MKSRRALVLAVISMAVLTHVVSRELLVFTL